MIKNTILKKIIFYGTFSALGIYFAEASNFNSPMALLDPLTYLAYGLINVFFLNALMKWGEEKLRTWYLYGFLLGLITETYVAKVTFYGLSPNADRFLGISPGAIIFVIMFFHAFFSFLTPCYVAARLLKMPFPIKFGRIWDLIIVIAPFLYTFMAVVTATNRGWSGIFYGGELILSGITLLLWVLLLRYQGDLDDVLLNGKEMKALIWITSISYIFLFIFSANKEHGVKSLPTILPLLGVSAIIIFLLWLLSKAIKTGAGARVFVPETEGLKTFATDIKRDKKVREFVPFDPAKMNLTGFGIWFFLHTGIILFFVMNLQVKLMPLCLKIAPIIGLAGFALGMGAFSISILMTIIYLLKPGKKEETNIKK
jgi:hypothetical protein